MFDKSLHKSYVLYRTETVNVKLMQFWKTTPNPYSYDAY